MLRRRRAARARLVAMSVVLACALAGVGGAPVVRSDDIGSIALPADATAVAVRMRAPTTGDLVSVYQSSDLDTATITAARSAAAAAGASSTVTGGFSVGMTAVRRGTSYVQRASVTSLQWRFPMGVSAMPLDAVPAVMGDRVAAAIGAGGVVMSATTAGLRGAQQGDVIDLVSANGSIVSFGIGLVATDAEVGGTEIVMSPEQAAQLGPLAPTRVLIYGTFDRTGLDVALASRGLYDSALLNGARIRVRRSWDPVDPDGTMGMARTKTLLGEFDYALTSAGDVIVDTDWRDTRIVHVDFADIRVRTNCNVAIVTDLQAALTEVAQSGLSFAIDLANTNAYGGCYFPRFNRITGSLGFLSRHSWGQPIDMNTLANAQGTTPKMDCRVVRIFRKHGFAWGGNFLNPDGMHFEWVGEPRNTYPYPSRFCPNLPDGAIDTLTGDPAGERDGRSSTSTTTTPTTPMTPTVRATFFADDGWGGGE